MKQVYKVLQFIKDIRQEKWLFIFVHLSVWLMLFLAFYLFSLRQNESLPVFVILLYLYGFILFYLNYLFLTPSYLLPKKYLAFSLSILAIILFSFFVVDPLIHKIAVKDFADNPPPEFRNMPISVRMKGEIFREGKPMPRHPEGMFYLLSSFLIFSSSVRIFQKLKFEEDINKQYHHERLNAELMMLRQQVNPHFLFNALNNILSLANRKSDQTSEAIVKLSAILRHMLSQNPKNGIPVTHEIDLIQNYIDLQNLWMKNTITIDFVVENVKGSYYIEPFILNPLVENAFKYGTMPGVASTISIHINMIEDWLYFKSTNPVVREILSEVGSMGIGVNNVIRRLELCYPGTYKIEIAQKENNYLVNLSIKLRKNELHCN
jgi:two-component system, LytTR family, sensor kinase